MNKRAVLALSLILLVCVILISSRLSTRLPFDSGKVPRLPSPPPPTIHINDGANLTDMIQQNGNVYTLTRDVNNYTIRVSESNVVIDGAGHSLQGTPMSERGIDIDEHLDNVTIRNLQIVGFGVAINVGMSSNITITGNNITGSTAIGNSGDPAIYFYHGSDNIITGNRITANAKGGIEFNSGSGNVVSDNLIADNKEYGIQLSYSSGTVLRNNRFENNTVNIAGISGNEDLDASNTVQGKPVCYWINVADKTVPLDAGLVVLISCKNITVKNLTLLNNEVAVMLFSTTNSVIAQNNLTGNGFGITVSDSQNNTIAGNDLANNRNSGIKLSNCSDFQIIQNRVTNNAGHGIITYSSHRNTITKNTLTANIWFGVEFHNGNENVVSDNDFFGNGAGIVDGGGGVDVIGGSDNLIVGNLLKENDGFGARVSGSKNSTFYHNDFINNKVKDGLQASNPWFGGSESNTWDNGTSGNYWSDYWSRYPNATEINGSGIGDTPFFINPGNIDRYPVLKPFRTTESPAP